jgi:hypothetical protein
MSELDLHEKHSNRGSDCDSDDNIYGEELNTFYSTLSLTKEIDKICQDSLSSYHMRQEQLTPASQLVSRVFSPGGKTSFNMDKLINSNSITELAAADYSRWMGRCVASEAMMAEVLTRYFGLQPPFSPPYTTTNSTGSNNSSSSSTGSNSNPNQPKSKSAVVHILEIILRPDTPTPFIMTGVEKVASLLHLEYVNIPPQDDSMDDIMSENDRNSRYREGFDGNGVENNFNGETEREVSSGHAVIRVQRTSVHTHTQTHNKSSSNNYSYDSSSSSSSSRQGSVVLGGQQERTMGASWSSVDVQVNDR